MTMAPASDTADRAADRIRAVIVDDEELARALLRELLAAHPDIEVIAECANGFEAVKAVNEQKPDLLLLDIQMPKLDGFDVLELIGGDVAVIFVTAYDSFAIRAFEVHAVDYLLKPFGAERLADALDRARARVAVQERPPIRELVTAAARREPPLTRVLIRDRSDVHVIPVEKIDYIEAQDDYAAFKVAGRTLLKEQTLGELETLLDPRRFVRIHRRYLLNVSRLSKIESSPTDSRSAVLTTGDELPISRSGYARLRGLL
jgi:two-component system LytT family response regulator